MGSVDCSNNRTEQSYDVNKRMKACTCSPYAVPEYTRVKRPISTSASQLVDTPGAVTAGLAGNM